MPTDQRRQLREIRTFRQLVAYLRDELDWPIESGNFEELTFEYEPEELGIDAKNAAKIEKDGIKRLRSLVPNQPWGIFFVKFEPKRLPVVALRRILGRLVFKKRASANSADRPAWDLHDLLFISSYGEGDDRRICLAHFSEDLLKGNLATLKVLGWDGEDTGLHLDHVADTLNSKLRWPDDEENIEKWREDWRDAFTLKHREVITTSQRLAVRLADLARKIRQKVNAALDIESDKGPLTSLMRAFQEALVHDLTEDDFADMYAQTIAYGLLSARVSRESGALVADDAALMVPITSPFLKELMETFLDVGGRKRASGALMLDFDELGINEVIETLRAANMEAVLRDFGDRNPQEDPVIHFYEVFLKEYDAHKRMQRGVFYTPRPVVSYIVRSVDELLRSEFGLEDGLADTTTWGEMVKRKNELKIPADTPPEQAFVQILDPATGTGTFLVEVIDLVHKTMVSKWKVQGHQEEKIHILWNKYVPQHLLPRLHGFELLMAPYAIAHMKLGLKLYETGYRFGSCERARIFLTNTLEPASDAIQQMKLKHLLPALAHESKAANQIKRTQRFTAVIGNPPYSVSSQNNSIWINDLCKDFKVGLESERNIQPLSDDYIKFLRFSLHVLQNSNYGVHGMVTNREYIQGVIHRALRKRLLEKTTSILICDLHGQRGELINTEKADKNIFEIEKGVAIGIFSIGSKILRGVQYGHIVGLQAEKAAMLLKETSYSLPSEQVEPVEPFYFFKPWGDLLKEEYYKMPSLLEWFLERPVTGFATHRDHFSISFDRDDLKDQVHKFIDTAVDDSSIRINFNLRDTRDWHLARARARAMRDDQLLNRIIRCSYRPFDYRWIIYSDDILEYSRRETMKHISRKEPALICSRIVKDEAFAHVFVRVHPKKDLSKMRIHPN